MLAGCPLAVAKLLVLPVRDSAGGGVIYPQTVFLEQLGDTPAGWGPGAGGKGHEKSRRRKGWPFGACHLLALGTPRMRAGTSPPRWEPGKAARPSPNATGISHWAHGPSELAVSRRLSFMLGRRTEPLGRSPNSNAT